MKKIRKIEIDAGYLPIGEDDARGLMEKGLLYEFGGDHSLHLAPGFDFDCDGVELMLSGVIRALGGGYAK